MGSIGLYKNSEIQEKIRFPITRAGDKSTVKYILRNEIGRHLDITKVTLEHPEITIEAMPKDLDPLAKKEIVLSWSPDKDSLTPLETRIQFEVVIGKVGQ